MFYEFYVTIISHPLACLLVYRFQHLFNHQGGYLDRTLFSIPEAMCSIFPRKQKEDKVHLPVSQCVPW